MNGERVVELLEAQLVDRVVTEILDKASDDAKKKQLASDVLQRLRNIIAEDPVNSQIGRMLQDRALMLAKDAVDSGRFDAALKKHLSEHLDAAIAKAVETQLVRLTVDAVRALLKKGY